MKNVVFHRKIKTSKSSFFVAFFFGLAASYLFYAFFSLLRDFFRVISVDDLFSVYPQFSTYELFLNNLFFSSIASILGTYVFLMILNKMNLQHKLPLQKFRSRKLLNDHSFVFITFISVFIKVFFIFGIAFLTFTIQFEKNWQQEYTLLLVLLPVVLFLNLWPEILRVFGKNSYRYVLSFFIAICVLSYFYANFNLINQDILLKKAKYFDPYLAYDLEVPESQSYSRFEKISNAHDLYVVQDKILKQSPLIFYKNQEDTLTLNELANVLKSLKQINPIYLIINLHMDKNLPYGLTKEIINVIRKQDIQFIHYSTKVKYSKYPSIYPGFHYLGIREHLIKYYPQIDTAISLTQVPASILEEASNRISEIENYNRVKLTVEPTNILLNDQPISKERLSIFIDQFIRKYAPNYVIIYQPSDSITYDQYITYLDLMYNNVDKIRNEIAYQKYDKPYEDIISNYDKYEIWTRYPINVVQWTEEERRILSYRDFTL